MRWLLRCVVLIAALVGSAAAAAEAPGCLTYEVGLAKTLEHTRGGLSALHLTAAQSAAFLAAGARLGAWEAAAPAGAVVLHRLALLTRTRLPVEPVVFVVRFGEDGCAWRGAIPLPRDLFDAVMHEAFGDHPPTLAPVSLG
ncbi:MAG: hypothetical protein VW338_04765 [Rhodospirillaceae bacterium]